MQPGTEAAGKMIAELKLRTQSGASVVGIERHGTSIVNPGPDEELESGDQILLIGSEDQLESCQGTSHSTEERELEQFSYQVSEMLAALTAKSPTAPRSPERRAESPRA